MIFGEREHMEKRTKRVHQAEALTEVTAYRIPLTEFHDLAIQSQIEDTL